MKTKQNFLPYITEDDSVTINVKEYDNDGISFQINGNLNEQKKDFYEH